LASKRNKKKHLRLNIIPKNIEREVGGRTTKISRTLSPISNRIVSANILADTIQKC